MSASINQIRRELRQLCALYFTDHFIDFKFITATLQPSLEELKDKYTDGVANAVYRSVIDNFPYHGDAWVFPIETDQLTFDALTCHPFIIYAKEQCVRDL